MKILLDYLFPITAIEPTPAASTAFLKQVCVLAKPKDGGVTLGTIVLATSMTTVNTKVGTQAAAEIQKLFDAGMTRVFILPSADLDIDTYLLGHESDFYTLLVSSDYTDANVTAGDFGAFKGVVGVSSTDNTFLGLQAAISNRSAFHTTGTNKAKNMFYAFGKLLSNVLAWRNQQFIPMPVADDVATVGAANALFDSRISFVITDDEFSTRLSMFAAGGKAIVAPYISKNLQIDLQSRALTYIAANQPSYTRTQAALLEDELQKVVDDYVTRDQIEDGFVEVDLLQSNFVASGEINIAEPKALWRIFAEMRQSL